MTIRFLIVQIKMLEAAIIARHMIRQGFLPRLSAMKLKRMSPKKEPTQISDEPNVFHILRNKVRRFQITSYRTRARTEP